MFRIELLPAERGDSIWVTYGPTEAPFHVIIDGGPSQVIPSLVPELERRISVLPGETDRVELLVETHIDADHIQGTVALLSDPDRVPLFKEVWLNGYRHLTSQLGERDAEAMTQSLLEHPQRWNSSFDGGPVSVSNDHTPVEKHLAGGLTLTLLSPTADALRRLLPDWDKSLGKLAGKGLNPPKSWVRRNLLGGFPAAEEANKPFTIDRSLTNRAGIAFIAEYEGKRVLFLADVPPDQIIPALDRLDPDLRYFDAVKVSHHGSRNNTSLEFCRRVESPRWLISTNGVRFGHPHAEALGRIIITQDKPRFYVNYVTSKVAALLDGAGREYEVVTPPKTGDAYAEGVTVDL
jgi:hypothetical protein